MNIKILSSLTDKTKKRNGTLTIGTHNGIFHVDKVVACAILCLINSNLSIQILRSRDYKMLNFCDLCIDIGGGIFDHHQAGFNKTRENGIKYASAELVWKSYGNQLIINLGEKYFSGLNFNYNYIFQTFDDCFISLVDSEDNGISIQTHCFSFVSSFLPLWFNNSFEDFNNQFYKALLTTITVLEEELKTLIASEIAKNIIIDNWKDNNFFTNGILELPSQTIDWITTVININNFNENNPINFIIFPYPNGGWAAQCVPPSFAEKFKQRISFPYEWAGQTTNILSEISGVEGATFCHNGCFFARATSKEAILKMCIIATKLVH